MKTAIYDDQSLLDVFVKEIVLTKEQLLDKLGCSWMTTWRLLKSRGYLTSYNHNARYYTLATVPEFDESGLWSYSKVRFSQYGTLAKSIVGLVCHSTAGLYANELEQRLQVNVRPALSRLVRNSSLGSHKLAGCFLYLDSQPQRAHEQLENRITETLSEPEPASLPNPTTIIALLVELIKTPNAEPELITRRLRRKGLLLSRTQARAVFAHYGLSKKKLLI